jgi:Arc/MetJ-type ribon-helix-helix transcriptional regulator
MAYQLPPDIDARVQLQLASGDFASPDDVLREALATLERRQRSLIQLQAMIREADEDIAAGRVGTFDKEATIAVVKGKIEFK